MKLKTPPVSPMQPRGRQRRDERPGDRGQPVAEEGQRHEGDDQRASVNVVRADDAGREQQTGDDRHLARRTRGDTPRRTRKSESNPEHSTPTNAARKGSEARKPDLMKSMPRYLDEIGREPGEEEPERRRERELADVDAPQLATESTVPRSAQRERLLASARSRPGPPARRRRGSVRSRPRWRRELRAARDSTGTRPAPTRCRPRPWRRTPCASRVRVCSQAQHRRQKGQADELARRCRSRSPSRVRARETRSSRRGC